MAPGSGRRFARGGLRIGVGSCLGAITTLVAAACVAAAQERAPAGGFPRPVVVGMWLGGARNAEIKTRLGHAHDRDLLMLALRGSWRLRGGARATLEYTADLIPLVVATGNRFYPTTDAPCTGPCPLELTTGVERRTAYGFGVQPVGIQWRRTLSRAVAVTVGGSGGMLVFTTNVPDEAEPRLNWVADVGGALHLRVAPRLAIGVGYRLQHISNGGRGPVNPGLNTHLMLVGLERPR